MRAPSSSELLRFLDSVGSVSLGDLATRSSGSLGEIGGELRSLHEAGFVDILGDRGAVTQFFERVKELEGRLGAPDASREAVFELLRSSDTASRANIALTKTGFAKVRGGR